MFEEFHQGQLARPPPPSAAQLSAEESCLLVQARWEEAMVALYEVADPDSDTLEVAEEEGAGGGGAPSGGRALRRRG